jgi:hypothetical protein
VWKATGWKDFGYTHYSKKLPLWVIQLHGVKRPTDEQIISNPWEELAQLQSDAPKLKSASSFIQQMITGTQTEKTALILALHRRLYHKPADDLKKLLHRSGVPMSVLSLVEDALKACNVCRMFEAPQATPIVKIHAALKFNAVVYCDLVFFDTVTLFVAVDESIRWTIVVPVEYKDFDSLFQCFRRNWVAHYGYPKKFRADRESVFNSERFATLLAANNCKLELVTAGDQHSWLGILDRRVQLLRRMFPRILEDMQAQEMQVDYADVAAECQIALDTQITHGGVSPYNCLYGVNPATQEQVYVMA